MKKQHINPSSGAKHGNDPQKNDPTKQDERDNDATRIRPEKENQQQPGEPSTPSIPGNIEEPEKGQPYKRTPGNPISEPGKKNNPAEPKNKENDTTEKDDNGKPVLKKYGKGL